MNEAEQGIEHEITYKNTVEFELNLTIPWKQVDEKLNEHALELKKTLMIPGYRPGRAPVMLIRTMFRKALEAEIEKWIPELIEQKVKELDLDLLGDVRIVQRNLLDDAPMVVTCQGMIWPPIRLKSLRRVKIKNYDRRLAEVETEILDREMRTALENSAMLNPVEGRGCQPGDVIRLRAHVYDKDSGKELTAKEGSETTVRFDHPLVHPAVRTYLEGKRPGEDAAWDMDILMYSGVEPDADRDFTHRRVRFEVTLEGVYTVELPDPETFMEQEGYESEEEWREVLTEKLARRIRREKERKEREILLDALVAEEPDIPRLLIQPLLTDISRERFSRSLKAFENVLLFFADREKFHDEVLQEARRRIFRDIAAHHLIRRLEITVTDEDLEAYLDDLASERNMPRAFLKAAMEKDPEEKDRLRRVVEEKKLLRRLKTELGLAPPEEAGESTNETEQPAAAEPK